MLLRWFASQADPVVKPGDWIADVTYERQRGGRVQPDRRRAVPATAARRSACPTRSTTRMGQPAGAAVLLVPGAEGHAGDRRSVYGNGNPALRSMVVYVDRSLQARTLLSGAGNAGGLQRGLDFAPTSST